MGWRGYWGTGLAQGQEDATSALRARRASATGQAESTLVPTSKTHLQSLQSLMRAPVLQVNCPEKVIRVEAGHQGGKKKKGQRERQHWVVATWPVAAYPKRLKTTEVASATGETLHCRRLP